MKNIFSGLILLSAITLGSCYEDKGNYSYHFEDINSVDTLSFTPEAYSGLNGWMIDYMKTGEADTTTERVTVNPTFSAPDKANEMEYFWYRSYTWNGKNVRDTLYTPGYMDVLIPQNGEVTYSVILEIRDRATDISYFTRLDVRTREWYTNSLFVLHGNSVNNMRLGNVETVGNEPNITLDAFEKANTDPNLHEPFKNARVLSYRMDAMSREAELAVFKTDGTAEVYNPFGLKRKYDNYFVMPPTGAGSNLFIAKTLINLCPSGNGYDFRALISNDGRFYTSRSLFRFYVPGTTTENTSHLTPDKYRIGTGVMSYSYYVFWDEKEKRFIHNTFSGTNFIPPFDTANREDAVLSTPVLDSQVDPDVLASLQSMQPVYAYVNNFGGFQQANDVRFIFYDPAHQRNLMCRLKENEGGKTRAAGNEENQSPFTADTISLPGLAIEPGTPIVYNASLSLDFFFYADGSTVYRYNVSNGDKSIIYEAPAGYEVSVLKFKQNDDYYYWGNLYRYLNIGLNRGSEGAVAEIKITSAGDRDEKFEEQFYEGFDNIVDLQFCNELQYQID